MTEVASRALGALTGLAIGDALGMPTQSLPRDVILERYGSVIEGFRAAPADHPLAAGLVAGSITDDTEQALLLAHLLIDGHGRIDPAELGRRLLIWEDDMRARGSRDLLGPSTKLAITNLLAGQDPSETGSRGTTNGAAMRITPVGIAVAADDLDQLVDQVTAASSLTHHTGLALAAASAVAAAISAGLSGADVPAMIVSAVKAAELGRQRGHWVAGAHIAPRIRWAVELVADADDEQLIDALYRVVGTSLASQESIPAAFAVFAARGADPWRACRIAASLGGDTDTIAAIVGAMCGAVHGIEAFPREAVHEVNSVNHLDLTPIAAGLLALRRPATGDRRPLTGDR